MGDITVTTPKRFRAVVVPVLRRHLDDGVGGVTWLSQSRHLFVNR
jgi:hypothetical protein